jgi:superfamily II DNA or RNA helicase
MSILTNIESLSFQKRQNISKDLELKIENKFAGEPRYVYPFEIVDDNIVLPFAYAAQKVKLKRPDRDSFPKMAVKFDGVIREEQTSIIRESQSILSSTGSVMISCYTGCGKTCCSIKLACTVGFKTLVVVNKLVLMKQWKESIMKFCPKANVQILTTKSKKTEADFYIMNAQNIEKMGTSFFADIGLVIVDEAHLIMAETLSKSLQYVFPRYLIGLTATPYRPDGLNILLELYFGKQKVIRELHREHKVYKVTTEFKPTVEYAVNGRVNWGTILDSQAQDVGRNDIILKIIRHFKDRNFLVLVKRIAQGEYLQQKLLELGEDVTSLLGSNQEFEVTSRILIGTTSKVGTGFDHPKLDTLLLATDVEEYFIQFLGRVFRTKDSVPFIFDLVDNYSILNKHWNTRRKVYQDHGGTIHNLNLSQIE